MRCDDDSKELCSFRQGMDDNFIPTLASYLLTAWLSDYTQETKTKLTKIEAKTKIKKEKQKLKLISNASASAACPTETGEEVMKCWHEAFVLHKMQCQCCLVSAVLPCVSFCWNRKIHLEKITQSSVGLITLFISLSRSLAHSQPTTTCTPNTPTILCSVSRPAKHPSSQPAIEPTRLLVFVNKMLGYDNNKQTNKQQFHATISNSGPAAFG